MEPTNKRRKNLQTHQPNVEYPLGNFGTTEKLVDDSNPVKYAYRDGKSGTTESRSIMNLRMDPKED